MVAALAGTVVRTPLPDATGQTGQLCADSTDTFAYVSSAKNAGNGKVFQVTISSGAVSAGSWPITGFTSPNGLALSADDTTLYILVDNGDLYSAPVSSPTATKIGSFNNVDSLTSLWAGLLLDPSSPTRLFVWNTGAKKIYAYDLGANAAGYYAVPGGTHFVKGIGRYYPDPNILLVTLTINAGGFQGDSVCKWYRNQHRWETIVGNGLSANSASGTAANQAAITSNANNAQHGYCADKDGRIYIARGTTTVSKIENGSNVLTDINTTLAIAPQGGMWYLPSLNQALVNQFACRFTVMS